MAHRDIHLAYRHRDQRLAELLGDQRALAAQERGLARAVLLELAAEHGVATAGDALDVLEKASPPERRALLDRARATEQMPSTADVDAHEQVAAATQAAVRRAAATSSWQACQHPGCVTVPLGPMGETLPSPFRRYWCEPHRHLAAKGDLEPAGPRLAYGPSGDIVDLDEREAEYLQAETQERERKAKRAALEEQRAHEAAELSAEREAKLAAIRAEHPEGTLP